jgi:hypothetical protein
MCFTGVSELGEASVSGLKLLSKERGLAYCGAT